LQLWTTSFEATNKNHSISVQKVAVIWDIMLPFLETQLELLVKDKYFCK